MNAFETAILTSADSIEQLRGSDVFRVLAENEHVDGLAEWIIKQRPDLKVKTIAMVELLREISLEADAEARNERDSEEATK
jgi:hypothetical protein